MAAWYALKRCSVYSSDPHLRLRLARRYATCITSLTALPWPAACRDSSTGAVPILRHRRAGLLSRVIEEHGARALAVRCDVTRAEEVKAALAMTSETFGRLDFAFNNAGIEPSKPAPTAEYDNEEWEQIIDINLRGVNTSSGAGNIGNRLDGWALLRKSLQPLALTKH
ncbi:MAG: SDR family oxidoreductase [Pirellulaceae bacterium]